MHLYNVLQLKDVRYMFHIYIEAVYLYCLRHEWRERMCLKGKFIQKSLLCISKKHVKVYSRSLLFTMLTQQQISRTMNEIKTEEEKKEMLS